MKFGPVPVAEAEGAILAHAVVATDRPYDRQLTYAIPKGTLLTIDHIADLLAADHKEVIVARLSPDDLHEDAAAARLAHALVPDPAAAGVSITRAATGRVNIYAAQNGILKLDERAVHAFNAVDPMITLSTLNPFARVAPRAMVATVKIISYGVSAKAVEAAVAKVGGALTVLPPVYVGATLIETRTSEKVPSDKGRRALKDRLQRLGLWLSPERTVVPHQVEALSKAVRQAEGEVIFILTGSATSDPADVGPTALLAAGGTLTQVGMPVDPGNLLFLGALGGKPVIGLPGCARSPALNGADWVMERVLCGVHLTPADFAAMGVGGLLKEIPTRPKPRGDIS